MGSALSIIVPSNIFYPYRFYMKIFYRKRYNLMTYFQASVRSDNYAASLLLFQLFSQVYANAVKIVIKLSLTIFEPNRPRSSGIVGLYISIIIFCLNDHSKYQSL